MNNKDKILSEIMKSTKRKDERNELWELISDAYDEGNVEEVRTKLQNKMEELQSKFGEAVEVLGKML